MRIFPTIAAKNEDVSSFQSTKKIIRKLEEEVESSNLNRTDPYFNPNPIHNNPYWIKEIEKMGFKKEGIWFKPTFKFKIKKFFDETLIFFRIKRKRHSE